MGTKSFSSKQSRKENDYITARRRRVLAKITFYQLAKTFDIVGPLSSLQCTQSLKHIDPDTITYFSLKLVIICLFEVWVPNSISNIIVFHACCMLLPS